MSAAAVSSFATRSTAVVTLLNTAYARMVAGDPLTEQDYLFTRALVEQAVPLALAFEFDSVALTASQRASVVVNAKSVAQSISTLISSIQLGIGRSDAIKQWVTAIAMQKRNTEAKKQVDPSYQVPEDEDVEKMLWRSVEAWKREFYDLDFPILFEGRPFVAQNDGLKK